MNKPTILVVEDDADLQQVVKYNFQQAGFLVHKADDGEEGLKLAKGLCPDLVVLDLLLPKLDGREVCRRLKHAPGTRHIPVLMLTALTSQADRIAGLEMGADDYLTKPFSPRELVLRAQAILRRGREQAPAKTALRRGPLLIDPERMRVELEGRPLQLTSTEFKLLHHLATAAGKLHSRQALLDLVWGYSFQGYSRTVDTHVRRLRVKLGQAGDYIETVRGAGYRFREGA